MNVEKIQPQKSSKEQENYAEKFIQVFRTCLTISFYIAIYFMLNDVVHMSIFSANDVSSVQHKVSKGHLEQYVEFIGIIHLIYCLTGITLAVLNAVPQTRTKLPKIFLLRLFKKQLQSPACVSILHFIVIWITIYFSVISSQISLWILKGETLPYRESFTIAFSLLVMSMVIFVLSQLSIHKTKKEEDQEIKNSYNERIEQLEKIIQLAPPNDFAESLSYYVDVADDFIAEVQKNTRARGESWKFAESELKYDVNSKELTLEKFMQDPDSRKKIDESLSDIESHKNNLRDQLESNAKYIRALLIAYARLAALFDGIKPSKPNNLYRANLMIRRTTHDVTMPGKESFRYLASILHDLENFGIEEFLTLNPEHSVCVYTDKTNITHIVNNVPDPIKFDPDENIVSFSMPYYVKKEQRKYNCFGAPEAIATQECQFIDNTLEEIDIWEKKRQPPKELLDEARRHFEANDRARSIISIPIMKSRWAHHHKNANKVLGVVNIYRDKEKLMMGEGKKQRQFVAITTPLNYALAEILQQEFIARYHANLLEAMLQYCDEHPVKQEKTGDNGVKSDSITDFVSATAET